MNKTVENLVKKPTFCVLQLSERCMFRCKMCHCWQSYENNSELTIEEGKDFILALKELLIGDTLEINIGGGEPLMKENILDLVRFIVRHNFSVTMTTNGFLVDEDLSKSIADSGMVSLPISLDSLDARIHNFLRGREDAYENAIKAIGYFLKYKGAMRHITVQTIIMEINLDGILDLLYWTNERGIYISFMAVMNPNPGFINDKWYEDVQYSFLWPKSIVKVNSIIDELVRLKKGGFRISNPLVQLQAFKLYFENPDRFVKKSVCSLGDSIVNVNSRGDIYLCWQMSPIGNIRTHRLKDIWYSESTEKIRNNIVTCKKNCAEMVNCFFEE